MKKQLERNLAEGMRKITPDVYQKIQKHPRTKMDAEDWLAPPKTSSKVFTGIYRTAAVLAACFLLFFGGVYYSGNIQIDSTINLDINPSIEILTNKKDQVVKAAALNEDGAVILAGMNLKKTDLNVAVNAIIGSMVKNGFITEVENSILVSVENKDTKKADEIKTTIVSDIKSTLSENHIPASIYEQKIAENKNTSQLAKQYGISAGKATFLQNLIEKDPSLTFEQLAPMSIEEIARLIRERNIDISDFAEYEVDESLLENVEEIIEEENEMKTRQQTVPSSGSTVETQPSQTQRRSGSSDVDYDDDDDDDDDRYDDRNDDDYDDDYDDDRYDRDDDYDDD